MTASVPTWLKKALARRGPSTHDRTAQSRTAGRPRRPEVPLNTNSSERDVRDPVTIRKISGGTRSDDGRRCRDPFLSLKKTCQKNAISFWAFLGDRLGITTHGIAHLPDLIRQRAAPKPR